MKGTIRLLISAGKGVIQLPDNLLDGESRRPQYLHGFIQSQPQKMALWVRLFLLAMHGQLMTQFVRD